MTDAELSILSILAEGPRYGHEIQQVVDARGLREWLTIGFASIYYLLNRLEKQGMIASDLRKPTHTGSLRKRYALTDAGHGVLQTAIAQLLREPRGLGSGFELGLANLHVLKPSQVFRVLRHHRGDLQQRFVATQDAYQRQQAANGEDIHHIRALYTHSLAMIQAELDWLDDFLDDWARRYPAVLDDGGDPNDAHEAPTALHRRTTPDPLKMIQRLRPLKPDDAPDTDPDST